MNEERIIYNSLIIGIIGSIIFSIVSLIMKDIGFLIGFLIGYLINIITYKSTIIFTDIILAGKSRTAPVMMFMSKILLYAGGFLLGLYVNWIHIVGVFFGYHVVKVTIFTEAVKERRANKE